MAAAGAIYRPALTPTQSGWAKTRRWVVAFEPLSPPAPDPLMGWIGSEFGARWSVAAGGIIVLLAAVAAVVVVSRRNSLSFRDNLRMVFRRRREPAV